MGKSKVKKEEGAIDTFRHKIELLKEQIKPYQEYNEDNLIAISKHVLKIFTKEEIAGKEENVSALHGFAYHLERSVIRPHFKIRWNKILPFGDTFYGIFPTVYCVTYHRDEMIAAYKERKEALEAYKKERENKNG